MTKVSLVGMTTPSATTGCKTAAELIAYAARVSNPANQANTKTAKKLLGYLIREGGIGRPSRWLVSLWKSQQHEISQDQIIRHRSFSFQEFSQRYAVSESFTTNREARKQHPTNRQLSVVDENEERQAKAQEIFSEMQSEVSKVAKDYYEMALNSGIAKEQARGVAA